MFGPSTEQSLVRVTIAALAIAVAGACAPQDERSGPTEAAEATDPAAVAPAPPRPPSPDPPPLLVEGRDLFDLHCAECHGSGGFGTTQGPPLVHDIYRPGHHADISFHLAVQRGVRSHHWNFGDMPPQPNVPVDRIQAIVDYVRWVQREAGVR
ncbi:MAG TPA: cytochrome c [Longimicrobiales bacterium]|nr:cytochrome c [Longimicrobiales bacterium]